jgi:hypothetical protein
VIGRRDDDRLTHLLDNAYYICVTVNMDADGAMTASMARTTSDPESGEPQKRKTGFALLDEEARKRIATLGGRASAKSDKARRWTRQTACAMAPLGGRAKWRASEQGRSEDERDG